MLARPTLVEKKYIVGNIFLNFILKNLLNMQPIIPKIRKKASAKALADAREWKRRNPEKTKLYIKNWRDRNPERVLLAAARRRELNREKLRVYNREYQREYRRRKKLVLIS